MEQKLNKDNINKILHSFDEKIKEPLRIDICDGAACILSHGIIRTTVDVDVINNSKDLGKFEKEIKEVEKEFELESEKDPWLSEVPGKVKTYLSEDYQKRTKRYNDNFKKLNIRSVSAGDIVIMKLAIACGQIRDELRDVDIRDIQQIELSKEDVYTIKKRLDEIEIENPQDGQKMRFILNSLRPEMELIPHEKNIVKNLDEYIDKVERENKIKFDEQLKSYWRRDIMSGENSMENIINDINAFVKTFHSKKRTKK